MKSYRNYYSLFDDKDGIIVKDVETIRMVIGTSLTRTDVGADAVFTLKNARCRLRANHPAIGLMFFSIFPHKNVHEGRKVQPLSPDPTAPTTMVCLSP